MKSVLCYGDSNTYGYDPLTGYRYPKDVRWTGRLQNLLGDPYEVIEEGCNGRTTIFEDPIEGWKSGLPYLKPCLNSHKPVDIVLLMLGTNDLKEMFHATNEDIARGVRALVECIQSFTKLKQGFVPKIVLISPIEIGPDIEKGAFRRSFTKSAVTRAKAFPEYYGKVAVETGCLFFDAAKHAEPSEADSLHMMPESHASLAEGLAAFLRALE